MGVGWVRGGPIGVKGKGDTCGINMVTACNAQCTSVKDKCSADGIHRVPVNRF